MYKLSDLNSHLRSDFSSLIPVGVFISFPLESRHWWRTRHLSRKLYLSWLLSQKTSSGDFSGGPVMKNPTAVAGDTSLVPGPGRSHIPRDCWALSHSDWATCPRARALQQERHLQWESPHLPWRAGFAPCGSIEPARRRNDWAQPKINQQAQSLLMSRKDCPRGSASWPQVPLMPPLLLSDPFTQQRGGQKPLRLRPLDSLPYCKILLFFFFLKWILFSLIFF